jgi:uncharacterized protein (TIGR02452 family)
MPNRKQRAEIANETVKLLEQESYTLDGSVMSLAASLKSMRDGTVLYTPNALATMLQSLPQLVPNKTRIEVRNCTTFTAAKSLVDDGYLNPLCLNFASAKNPGGGFLSGSQAQEECLARASGLYQSLNREKAYYDINRSYESSLYTNYMIYSPSVPIFRNDDDALISNPYTVSIVTSPAANARAVRQNEPELASQIRPTMEERIRSILAVGRQHEHNAIVLGAWGCGVFGNDPSDVAEWFYDALQYDHKFVGAFDRVVFAVLDYADGTPSFNAFYNIFANNHS